MTSSQLYIVLAIITTVLAVAGFVQTTRRGAREAAKEDEKEKATIRGEAFAAGAASRNDEIKLLTSERDDARRTRDRLQRIVDRRQEKDS